MLSLVSIRSRVDSYLWTSEQKLTRLGRDKEEAFTTARILIVDLRLLREQGKPKV